MSLVTSFSRYQIKYVIKFLIRQFMTSQTLWLTGKKREEEENTKT